MSNDAGAKLVVAPRVRMRAPSSLMFTSAVICLAAAAAVPAVSAATDQSPAEARRGEPPQSHSTAPAYRSSTKAEPATAATSITIATPAGVVNGDVLIAWIAPAGTAFVINSVPSGWTQIDQTGARGTAYYKVANSEPASYVWGFSASVEATAIIGAWSGVNQADPILAFRRSSRPSGSHVAEAPVSGLPHAAGLVALYAFGRGSTTTTGPAGWAMPQNPDSGGTKSTAIETAMAHKAYTGGALPSPVATTSNATGDQTVMIVLRPLDETEPIINIGNATTVATATDLSSQAAAVPIGAVAGDLLVALVHLERTSGTPAVSASGWTVKAQYNLSASGGWSAVLYRVVVAGEPASHTFAYGLIATAHGIVVVNVRDAAATGDPFAAIAGEIDPTSDTAWTVPGLTMSAQPSVLLSAVQGTRGDHTIDSGAAWPSPHAAVAILNGVGSRAGFTAGVGGRYNGTADPASFAVTAESTLSVLGVYAAVKQAVPPSTPDLDAASDTGTSSTDDITNDATPTLLGSADAGAIVTIYDGPSPVGSGAATGGSWSITTSPLGDGSHSLSAKVGSISSAALSVTIDTAAPTTPSTPDLDAASDTGASSTDNITSDTTPSFTGTAEAGATVTIYDSATPVGTATATGGNWSITTSALGAAVHAITAKATDTAGNVSVPSGALSVTIDTTTAAPSTPDLDTASDTGASSTDNITSDTTPTFNGAAESSATVTVYDGATPVGTATATGGSWSVTTSALSAAVHSITARATDPAGNASVPSGAVSVTIDTTAPPVPSTPNLHTTSDTGSSSTDNITSDATPTFTGTTQAGTTVTVYDGASPVGSAPATGGNWSVTTSALGDADHAITAKAGDVAGNLSAQSAALSVAIDTSAPAPPSIPDLEASSDSGPSSSDDITNDATPVFTGTADPGIAVDVLDGGGAVGSGTATGGAWSITTSALSDNAHTITAKTRDVAGNASAETAPIGVRVDTVAPTGDVVAPDEGTTVTAGATTVDVTWTTDDSGSGVAATTIARETVGAVDGVCPTLGWSTDLSSAPATSPNRNSSLSLATCYRWVLGVTDGAGNGTNVSSGNVRLGQVAIVSPEPANGIFDVEPLAADAESPAGITRVEFVADEVTLGSDSTAPYTFDWSTLGYADGDHTVQARLIMDDLTEELAPPSIVAVRNDLPSDERIRLDHDRGRLVGDDHARFAVYAWGANQLLPARYRSDAPLSADLSGEITPEEFASLSTATQVEIEDFFEQDLRGIAYAPPPGIEVGRYDDYYTECTNLGGAQNTTKYCIHTTEDGHFRLVYFLSTPSHAEGVPEIDFLNEQLQGTPSEPQADHVPDVVDKVAWSLQEARAKYEEWGYRALPEVQTIQFRRPPCPNTDGCASNWPGWGLELSIASGTTRPIYLARHELFHLVQYRYAMSASGELPGGIVVRDDTAFWTEATAEWAARKVDASSTQRDTNHEYAKLLASYLDEPTLPLELWETAAEGQRQYGMFIFAAYLSERFGEPFLRQIWEKRAPPEGKDVDVAIDELAVPESTRLRDILDDYARTVYLMDFDDTDKPVWLSNLNPNADTQGDPLGTARPERDLHPFVTDLPESGTISIDPGGFKILEFVPVAGVTGTLHIVVDDNDVFEPPEVHARLLAFDSYPTVCDEVVLESGADDLRNWNGVVDIPLGPGSCTWAALILTNSDSFDFDDTTRTLDYTVRFIPGSAFDSFDRVASNGWGAGGLGLWETWDPSYDQYLSVDGAAGVVNQIAPLANGDITLGVPHLLADPAVTPIDIVFTFRQSAPGNATNPFIDNVFYVASDLDLDVPWVAVEIYNSPSSQYQAWEVAIGDDRPLDLYLPGAFTPSPFGDSIKLRMRVDAFGSYAKLWMATSPEPEDWTASKTRPTALPPGWSPDWIVLHPRQNDDAGSQTFTLEEVEIVSGSVNVP